MQHSSHRQFLVDGVLLRHVADHRAIEVEVAVQIIAIDQHLSLGPREAIEGR